MRWEVETGGWDERSKRGLKKIYNGVERGMRGC